MPASKLCQLLQLCLHRQNAQLSKIILEHPCKVGYMPLWGAQQSHCATVCLIAESMLCCRDAIMPQHSYEIPARSVRYTVKDNLLLVFNDVGAVYVIDVDATAGVVVAGPQPFHMAQSGVCIPLLIEQSLVHADDISPCPKREPSPCVSLYSAKGMPM